MTRCHRCAEDVYPFDDMQADGRLVACCPKCTAPLGPSSPAVDTPTPKGEGVRAAPAGDHVAALRSRLGVVEAQIQTPEQRRALIQEARRLRAALRALGE